MPTYPEEIKESAKLMYLRRCSVKDIANKLSLNSTRVVYQWAEKFNWNDLLQHETVEQATSRKLIQLIEKENKTDADYKEINHLKNLLDTLANIDIKKARALKEKTLSESGQAKNKKGKAKPAKNDISHITKEQLDKVRKELFFDYQHLWYDNKHQRTRFILKSRQIGATYYFAWEAFEDAVLSGDNQIFLSASRSQAEVFKAYIIKFASEFFDVELKGSDCIILSNGAELRFVSTNSRTAQSYHGHLYIDEVFWIPDFENLNKVASAMASQKKWRKTYFSTPSTECHGAYAMWSGEKYNNNRKNKVDFDVTAKNLKDGKIGPDRIWRNVITIKEAERKGCDLFDIEQLKTEYTTTEFDNLFMCKFIQAGLSVFNLNDLLNCAVDSNVVWVDFKAKRENPIGNRPVWIGYDPARFGDHSSVVVIAPPIKPGEKFRVLEKHNLKGSFAFQAERIKEIKAKYNVQFIGIDATGPGLGVFEKVKEFYPRATPIHYGLNTKTNLVLKGMDIIEHGRIQWDAEHTDIPQSFMQITKVTTSNDQITYDANRNKKTGHADVAWAILNALSNEPLSGGRRTARIGISK